jgi:F-type H+-transporting ATPase subunit b
MSKKMNRILSLFISGGILVIASNSFAADADGNILAQIGIDPKMLLLQVLGFLVVLFVLWKFVFGRVGGLLEDRQNEIVSRMNKLESDQQELDRLTAETRQRLNDIEAEGQEKIQAAIEQGNGERQAIVDEARREAAAELERARTEIQREKEGAILELRGIVAEIAIDAASQIIDQKLDADGHQHIIDEYLNQMPDGTSQN